VPPVIATRSGGFVSIVMLLVRSHGPRASR
jgi:hypothetical protein